MNRLTRTPSDRGLGDQRPQALAVRGQAPAVVGLVNWPTLSGTKVHWCGLQRAHEVHQVVERVALDVELGLRPSLHQRGELVHVVRADVALVGPRVHGDAVRAGLEDAASAARVTLGMPRWRVLRSSATLLTLTDSAVRPHARWASGATSGFIGSGGSALRAASARRPSPGACAAAGASRDDSEARARSWLRSGAERQPRRRRAARRARPLSQRGLQRRSARAPSTRRSAAAARPAPASGRSV